ncbi:MAG: hypothetical protein HY075_09845 [Deltaproteobacteria bacterium]|nr:hypothetical protein [Deltaproteobacteria bacterium]
MMTKKLYDRASEKKIKRLALLALIVAALSWMACTAATEDAAAANVGPYGAAFSELAY